jgi:hypothetical protein
MLPAACCPTDGAGQQIRQPALGRARARSLLSLHNKECSRSITSKGPVHLNKKPDSMRRIPNPVQQASALMRAAMQRSGTGVQAAYDVAGLKLW